ncbi:MAG: threonine synthase [Dongiaceae bacterium]
MRYVSTRGAAPTLGFEEVLLAGLARDGGLYVPESWPAFDAAALGRLAGLSYRALAFEVVRPFVGEALSAAELAPLIDRAYDSFGHRAVAPLKQLDQGLWLLELFHGPTLAFKDVALQLVGGLFDHVLRRRGRRITIVGATSGDTGSAAIEAVRDRAAIDIFMLHPHGRVSEVQRRQMTTVASANVHNIAIEGSFDDCQDLVKAMFADAAFRDEMALSAVNSINWARVMAQTVYYFAAALALGAPDRQVAFAVPTGNFGNVYAGYAARAMGLPVARLLVGSNRNDILTRCLEADDMSVRPVEPSLSPSMDIQISSNFERLLFDLGDRDGAGVAAAMAAFRRDGKLPLGADRLARARRVFAGYRVSDEETLAVMRDVHRRTGELIDPHSAIAVAGGWQRREPGAPPLVALGTAHPAKFPDAVERATGIRPPLPPHLADLYRRTERCTVLPAELGALLAHIRSRRLKGAA